jgi:hypothetical protein
MQKTINLAVLLLIALAAGCMYTINGNPDVSLTDVRLSPTAMTLPLLDSGDRAGSLDLLGIVTGDGTPNLTWISSGIGTDSIYGHGLTATYFLAKSQGFVSLSDTVRATSLSDFSRFGKIIINYTFPNAVSFYSVPMDVTVLENSAVQFVIDTIHGHTLSNVSWSVLSGPGTITNGGLYIAPSSIPKDSAVAVILAQSGLDTSTSTVHILFATDSLKCFTRDIKPIIGDSSGCAGSGCHGGGGDRGAFNYIEALHNVKPGNARASRLYQIITELNANERMPPPPSPALTPQQVLAIGQWIDQGALDCR